MERRNDKPVELTTEQLDIVIGGKAGHGPTDTLPRNPYIWPAKPKQ